jgi:PTH1 family peptidyl-tRNA hydrolase
MMRSQNINPCSTGYWKLFNYKVMEQQEQFNIQNIKLIIGLGNIGKEYEKTRHNVGFMFVDELLTKSVESTNFSEEKKLRAFVAGVRFGEQKIVIAKPTTLMNNSGLAVSLLQNYYKVSSSEILIVHDDLDITLGNHKLQFKKGPHIHNGINSIEDTLKTSKFWRLRIGVENRKPEERQYIQGIDYVLGRFSGDERESLNRTFSDICKKLLNSSDL